MTLLFARNWGYGGDNPQVSRFVEDSRKVIRAILTVSRLNYRPEPFKFTLRAERIADIKGESLSLQEVCAKRAGQLLDEFRASGLTGLNVMWSGGIDSTLAVLSLLRYWPEQERRSLGIVLTAESIAEYPRLWYGTLRHKIKSIYCGSTKPYDRIMDDALLVTGELGDQCFGSDIINEVILMVGLDSLWAQDYRDTMIRKITVQTGDKQLAERFISLFEPIVKECPIRVRNAADFLWWYNFSQKWQYVKYRCSIFSAEDKVERNVGRTHHFFDSQDFQRWAIEHHEENFPSDWQSYKEPAKRLIVSWTGDEGYMVKTKFQSLSAMMDYHDPAVGMTDDYRYVDSLDSYGREGWTYAV